MHKSRGLITFAQHGTELSPGKKHFRTRVFFKLQQLTIEIAQCAETSHLF